MLLLGEHTSSCRTGTDVMTIEALFGTRLPIIQAPMAGVQDIDLAIEVSRAGGLGSLPCAMLNTAQIEASLVSLAASKLPYNINFFCHNPPIQDPATEIRWRAALAPYYAEFGLTPPEVDVAPARKPYNEDIAALLDHYKPPVVSFHFGLPDRSFIDRIKSWHGIVLSSATSVQEAEWLEANGADVIIAQGLEAGGHRGIFLTRDLNTQTGTMALLPQIVSAVSLPVIAAGAISTPEAVTAALAMGASGVQAGTAYLLATECKTSALHRKALREACAGSTALTNIFSGGPARSIVNKIMRELGPISEFAPPFPLAGSALAPLRAAAEKAGRNDFTPLWSGQNGSACREASAAEITCWLAGETLINGGKQ